VILVKASDLNKYIGQKVRVVYSVQETANTNQMVFIYGSDITDEVILKGYNPNAQTVEFERLNGRVETVRPVAVLSDTEL